jgi:outer membrane lipoprotein SlyB
MRPIVLVPAAAAVVTVVSGCAPSMSGGAYTREEARHEHSMRLGVVESVRRVRIEGTRSGIGPGAGAIVGSVAGSNVGSGKGAAVGVVLGSVAGGIAGQAAEEAGTRKAGLEITVKLDGGPLIAVTQEADEAFKPGEKVRIISDGMTSRVTH